MAERAPLIGICGTSTASPAEYDIAREAGRLVATRGAIVVCGGLLGVMEAAAEGASDAGGLSIGLLPGRDPAEANRHLSIALPTGLGEMRNGLIANTCAAMISIGGGYGTLSEIGFMLRLGKPVAGVSTWPVYQPGSQTLDPAVFWAGDAASAIDWLFAQIDA